MRVNVKTVESCRNPVVPKWSQPSQGRLKVNVDGAWNKELILRGAGIVIRDSKRVCIAAASKRCDDVFPPFQVEALAAREGLVVGFTLYFFGE
ncbi:hypothetical protein D8674_030518 [Pyrus ussuriensis x Pyrus communis]|uniref:RNase H type-1 domain-containing protein n=1 Tax=Pyrus ussuriensis x Pyrus communis TaxID=2448454 RepID=A0A5N5EVR5_9ROSA|nr:hypothetical protein D8674_030518 [Pyrus ussuriensis x Pyrus communis]